MGFYEQISLKVINVLGKIKTWVIYFFFPLECYSLLILVDSVYIPKREIYLWVIPETWEVINLKHIGGSSALLLKLNVSHDCCTQWIEERKT